MLSKDWKVKRINKAVKLENQWTNYKRLRGCPKDCTIEHPDFITIQKREDMLDKLFYLIFDSQ